MMAERAGANSLAGCVADRSQEVLKARTTLPPLLINLSDRRPEKARLAPCSVSRSSAGDAPA